MKLLHILGSNKATRTSETTAAKVYYGPTFEGEDSMTERSMTFSSDEDSSSVFSSFGASANDSCQFSSPKPTQKIFGDALEHPTPSEDKCSTEAQYCANGEEKEEIAPTTTVVDGGTGKENSTAISSTEDAGQYGYGDVGPDKYEYDDAPPTSRATRTRSTTSTTTTHSVSRRSSMKQENCPRRTSIQFGGGAETQVYVPCQRQTVRRRNSITFNESVFVRNVEPIASLTDEPEALWIQCDEYREMKMKMKRLANLVDTGSTGGRNYCIRGLEPFMKANAQKRMNTKNQAWDTVLDEQCRQEDEQIFDDETLANSYKLTSVGTKIVAAQRAKEDEKAIAEYTRSTRLMMRRMSM